MSCSVCVGHTVQSCPVCGPQFDVQTCPTCKGTGEANWKVFDIHSREVVNCTELAFLYAAETEDDAEQMGQRYCKESCVCQTCNGTGEINSHHI